MADAAEMIAGAGFHLPPFAHWTLGISRPRDARDHDGRLEQDITDYGQGDFDRQGCSCSRCAMAIWSN